MTLGNKIKNYLNELSIKNDLLDRTILACFQANFALLIVLLAVTIAAYGFELFNLHLTIDEEVNAFQANVNIISITSGRWSRFFLTKLLFDYSIIPFSPLFIALAFHILSVLLIIKIFNIRSLRDQILIGVIGVSYPGLVFIYSFSTLNFSVGIGLFCISLSLYLYKYGSGTIKLLAILPAAFALGVYQPLLPILICAYLLYAIFYWNQSGLIRLQEIAWMLGVVSGAVIIYYLMQQFVFLLFGVTSSSYVEKYFNFQYLFSHTELVFQRLYRLFFRIYTGAPAVYGLKLWSIPVLLFCLGVGIISSVYHAKTKWIHKLFILFLLAILLITPFIGGILTRGIIPLRALLAVPPVLMGLVILGTHDQPKLYKSVLSVIIFFCAFQFVSATNHLFASAHITYMQDQVLGTQLISRIEESKTAAGSEAVHYLEMIGYVQRTETPLTPQLDVVGASFFGWDQGHSARVVAFLKVLGYDSLSALPLERRVEYIDTASRMPTWPAIGSVQIVGDVVLVKFGDYSPNQRQAICESPSNGLPDDFCSGPSQ